MKKNFCIIGQLQFFLLFVSCNSEKKQVKTALEEMTSAPIQLNLDKMEARRNPLTKLDGKYILLIHNHHGKKGQLRMQMDSSDNTSQRQLYFQTSVNRK